MNVLPVQSGYFSGLRTSPIKRDERPQFSGGFDGFIGTKKKEIAARKQKIVDRFLGWLAVPEYQPKPTRERPVHLTPGEVLGGETGKFYDLLVDYTSAVYSGRLAPATLKHFGNELERTNLDELNNEDKAFHLIFKNDVKWRRFMTENDLRMGYNDRLMQDGDLTFRLGSPTQWVERILQDRPSPFKSSRGQLEPGRPNRSIGREIYDAILQYQLYAGMDSDQLIRVAEGDFSVWRDEMNKLAKEIDPDARDWRDVYGDITKNHPLREDVIDTYKQEADRATKFLKEKNLVNVPSGYRLRIEETPGYYRADLPFAAYVPSRLTFWVTVTMNDDADTEEEQLRAHNYSDIKAVTVHEAFPGHHLDQIHKRAYGERLDPADPKTDGRKFLLNSANWDSAPYSEGWGLYAETVMYDSGYYNNTDKKQEAADKLTALRCMLWRSARAFLDAQIHTGRITSGDAVDFLVENLVMQRDRAEAEVNRYVENPGQVTTYYMGMKQFKSIWEKAKANNPELTLFRFHNAMLKRTMPVPALGLAQYGV